MELRTVQAPCELQLLAATDRQPLPRLEIVANSGQPFRYQDFPAPVIIDMQGVSFAGDTLPILLEHDTNRRVGHTSRREVVEGSRIEASAIVSSSMRLANDIVADLANGFPFQASIGADVQKADVIKKGQSVSVNGAKHNGPLIVARKSRVKEVSITVFGADEATRVSLAASGRKKQMSDNDNKSGFETWLEAGGMTRDELTDEQAQYFAQQFADLEAARTRPAAAPERLQNLRDLEANEEKRLDSIRAVFKKAEYQDIKQVKLGKTPVSIQAFKDRAMRELDEAGEPAWSPDAVELRLMHSVRDLVPKFAVHSVDDNLDSKALVCALCRDVCGVPDKATVHRGMWYEREYGLEAMFDEKVLEASHSPKVTKYNSLHALMDLTIQLSGRSYSGSRKSNEFIREFNQSRFDLKAAGGFTTLEATNLLEDAANKTLLAEFEAQETVWNLIATTENVPDFKVANRYRLITGGGYQQVGADGELVHGSLKDEKETVQAATYGQLIALSRTHMVNDDLGAFMAIPRGLGRLAALKIEEAVFVLLLANTGSFFAAGNNNLQSGSTTDLDITGLSLAEQTFGDFVDTNGLPILVSPDRILVGTQDWAVANQLFTSSELRPISTAGGVIDNPHAQKFRPIKSPYINNTNILTMDGGAAISNQDTDQWYMFANPDRIAALVVAFLNGRRVPVMESEEAPFNTLGMMWRSYHDWGVAFGSEEGAVKMAGA